MFVVVHTHVRECPCHIGEQFIHDARVTAGEEYKEISVDLDKHWGAMQPVDLLVVLGFGAGHVVVLVPNEYDAEHVSRHPAKLIPGVRGFVN